MKIEWLQPKSNLQLLTLYKTVNYLAKLVVGFKWLWIWTPLQSLNFQILCPLWAKSYLTFKQLQIAGLILEIKRMLQYNKKGLKSPVKWHNYEFLPLIFPNLGHLECYTPPPKKQVLHVVSHNNCLYACPGMLSHSCTIF